MRRLHHGGLGPSTRSAAGDSKVQQSQGEWLRLVLTGPAEPLDATVAFEACLALHALGISLGLELVAEKEQVETSVICRPDDVRAVERALRGSEPRWELARKPLRPMPRSRLRLFASLGRRQNLEWAPLRAVDSFKETDSLSALLEAVQPLAEDELFGVRYLTRPVSPQLRVKLQEQLTQPVPPASPTDLVFRLLGSAPRMERFEPRLQRTLEARAAGPAFEIRAEIVVAGNDRGALEERWRDLGAVLASRLDAGFGGLLVGPPRWQIGTHQASVGWEGNAPVLFLACEELATLWHVPSGHISVPGVTFVRRPATPLPAQLSKAQGLELGVHLYRGEALPVRLPLEDLHSGHLVHLGRTGVGKSTFTHQLLRQVAASVSRPGLAVIDPHGDFSLDFVLRSIPPTRGREVVLLELGDREYPVGLPLFSSGDGVPLEDTVQAVFSLLRIVFKEQWSPTRMEDAVFAITATLCRLPGATLLDVPRLLNDSLFRRRVAASLRDPVARDFWRDYEALSEASRRELTRPILYRLRALYRAEPVRNVICRADGLDFAALMERHAILLVSLAGSAIQAEADLLGELIITRLHLAAMSRLDRPHHERTRFYLAVDESQRFKGASLPVLLSEARKLGLTLVLSTQYLDAWSEALSESILGNVGTLVAFRCGPSDSRRLAANLKPFSPDDLENLDRHEAIVKMQVGGQTLPAFDIRTLPVNAPENQAMLERVREQTRQAYAKPRRQVEDELTSLTNSRGDSVSAVHLARFDVDEE